MADTFNWGILGTGNIAKKFAEGLTAIDDAKLVAVGSRSQEGADAFGEQFDVPNRHASYEALADDKDVDAIYVATPHPMHKPATMMCIDAGKPVLCEKPFTINAADAREVIKHARGKGVYVMEAMWSRFFPVACDVRQWIADGKIGDVLFVTADFGFRAGFNPKGRLFAPELGGGALLDVGVYAVSFASMIYGTQPTKITSMAELGETKVDEHAAMLFGYADGAMAALRTSIRVSTTMRAQIEGTEGKIDIPPLFWRPESATLTAGGTTIVSEHAPEGNGWNYEAAAVMEDVRAGKTENDIMPLDETIAIMETMDKLRADWGVKYPME